MSTWYQPEKVLVCVRLAGDHQAGVLLYVIMRRYPYAKATLKGTDGTWSANERTVWFKAAGMSRSQGDRALRTLDELGLIERGHGSWGGNPNVLHIRPTRRAQAVWHTATTFEALDAVLGKDNPLHELWKEWPDEDPKKLGMIAEWYEQLGDRKKTADAWGQPINLKPCAQDLLHQITKSDPAIVDTKAEDLLPFLWQGTYAVAIKLSKEAAK